MREREFLQDAHFFAHTAGLDEKGFFEYLRGWLCLDGASEEDFDTWRFDNQERNEELLSCERDGSAIARAIIIGNDEMLLYHWERGLGDDILDDLQAMEVRREVQLVRAWLDRLGLTEGRFYAFVQGMVCDEHPGGLADFEAWLGEPANVDRVERVTDSYHDQWELKDRTDAMLFYLWDGGVSSEEIIPKLKER